MLSLEKGTSKGIALLHLFAEGNAFQLFSANLTIKTSVHVSQLKFDFSLLLIFYGPCYSFQVFALTFSCFQNQEHKIQ